MSATESKESKDKEKEKEKDSNGEDLKIFTMRNIPEATRKRWKIICLLESITMEEFALQAIQEKIIRHSQERSENAKASS